MNANFCYLDKPVLPQELIIEIYKSLNNSNIFNVKDYKDYELFDATYLLKEYTKSIFPFEHNTRVQRIHRDLLIHKDFNRVTAYNYIVEQGGSNVETCFYNDKFMLIDSYVIEKNKWHALSVNVNHNVKNVECARIALTVHVPLN